MRRFSGSDSERKLNTLKRIGVRGKNVVAMFECFYFEGSFYAVSENFSYSLLFFNRARLDLLDFELATIFKQVGPLDQY